MSKKILLEELIRLEGPRDYGLGICDNLTVLSCMTLRDIGQHLFRSWVNYSGSDVYPVPHPEGSMKGYINTDNLWEGEYGELRKDLLRHMIDTIKEEIIHDQQ